jgi:HlyD family secretion protein
VSQMHPRRRQRRSKKFKLAIALAVLAAVAGLVYFNLKKEKPAETFATVYVRQGELVDKLAETGTIELVRTVEVKSTIAGNVRQLLVEAGAWVEKGQLMAVIEPDPNQSLQLYQKRSAVEQGRINLKELEKDVARRQGLFDRQMVSAKDLEDAQTNLVRARNALRLAELELEILETMANLTREQRQAPSQELSEVRVLAPISGVVIRRGVEIGEVVASGLSAFSGGTLLFEIGDPSQLIIRGDIAEIDIAKLRVGQQVGIVVDAYPDTTYRGQVRWIAPVGQKKQGSTIVTFDVEIDVLDREPNLRQGMSCDIDVIFSRRDSTLFLPVEAALEVFDGEQKDQEVKGKRGRFVAYAAPDSAAAAPDTAAADSARAKEPPKARLDEFAETALEIGLKTTTQVEVLSGLRPGQRVAADPKTIRAKLEEKAKAPEKKKGWF